MKKKINFNLRDQDLDVLPHSEKMERKVLAYICNNPDVLSGALRFLKFEGIFYGEFHSKIWECIICFSNENMTINPENISEHFRVIGENDISTYVKTFSILSEWFINPNQFKSYLLKINEYSIQRTIHRVGFHLNQESLKPEKDALELLGEASEGLDKIYQHHASLTESTMEEAVEDLYKTMFEANSSGGLLGLPSTLASLNDKIKGYRKGNLIIIGASTGEGKTTLAWQDAVNLAEKGFGVGYVSLEMSMTELAVISASERLKIPSFRIIEGNVSAEEQTRITGYMSALKSHNIKISDKSGLRIGEIKALARMWVKNNDIKILFIDHLHLAYDDTDHSNPEQRFTNIANKLKELSKELNIPVVALAQLARREKSDKNRKHVISDLKYAGGIEQAADVILLLYRPYLHGHETNEQGESNKELAYIVIGKLRLMEKKDIQCRFTGTAFLDNEVFEKPNAGIKGYVPF